MGTLHVDVGKCLVRPNDDTILLEKMSNLNNKKTNLICNRQDLASKVLVFVSSAW